MNRRRATALIGIAFAIALAGCSIIRATPTPTTPTGTLQGVVTGSSGPVAGAQVAVTASDATQHVGSSDSNGFYSISGIPVGPATYTVNATGYAPYAGAITIIADPGPNHQDISLNPQ
ncbi:MAG TPA: carboxypeptidase-like regulatory domain-containing protein [Candidatus Eremiobacteraceae bacterium]|nr:carboxypeptidase-like regulatory domain-containing protein [Candidatus Eremiobacteraceae bacterium]